MQRKKGDIQKRKPKNITLSKEFFNGKEVATIRICKNRNVLKEYLQNREKEVADIMMVLYDQDEVVEMYGRSKKREGEIKGTIETLQSVGMTMKDAIAQIAGKFDLPEKEAKTEVSHYWKKPVRSHRS